MSAETASIRSSREELDAQLRVLGCTIKGKSVTCPFHEDKHASASIYRGDDGAWRLKCHVPTCGFCGDVFDIRAKSQGRDVASVLKEVSQPKHIEKPKRVFATIAEIISSVSNLGEIEARYEYANPDSGAVEVVQVRYREGGRKKFLVHHNVPTGFILGAPPKPWPIYNRRRVREAHTVVIVEGEKCVHALHQVGVTATTSLSGASNADKADWSLLAGKKVYIWPDNDAPGAKYAADVARMLDKLSPRPEVYLLTVSCLGLPDSGDAADFLEAGESGAEVWQVLADGSEPVGANSELQSRIDQIIAGKWKSFDWPWPVLSSSARSLFPGSVTVVCGDPAASKSFFILQAALHWMKTGIGVAVFELEDDRAFHMLRLLAILEGSWKVLDDEWGRSNPDELRRIYEAHRADVEAFSQVLYAAPVGQLRYVELLEWIEERCALGTKILIIDPITAIYTGDSRQVEDLSFIIKATSILRTHEARLILVTHPRMGANKKSTGSQDDLAGGRAFSRHTQTVLWLHAHHPAERMLCETQMGNLPFTCNRSIGIAKARNAPGHGWKIGFSLGHDVRFNEHGIIAEEDR